MTKRTFLFFLPALCLAVDAGADGRIADAPSADGRSPEVLIAAPGDELRLEAPDTGASIEAALGGGPLKPVTGTLTAPAAGDHWLAVASRDRSGKLSPIRWIRLEVDGEAPRVDLETEPAPVDRNRLWMPPDARVSASAADALAGVGRLFLAMGDEVSEVPEASAGAVLPAAGEVTVRAWAVDRVGNRSAETTLDLTIDSTPPAGEVRAACEPAAGAAETVVPPDCRIEVKVHDAESGDPRWTPRIDGGEATAETLAGPWTAGRHTVEVDAVDAVGNRGRIGPYPFVVDAAGPEIAWRVSSPGVVGEGGETFYRPPVEVTAEAGDAPAGLEQLAAAPGGGAFRPVEGPLAVDGDRLSLKATDRVGNVTETLATWRIDVDPPEVRLETGDGRSVEPGGTLDVERGDAIRLRVSDPGAGVERAVYRLGVEPGQFWRRWWWNRRPKPVPEPLVLKRIGEVTLSVEAADRLGNRSTTGWQVVVRRPGGGS